MSKEKLIEHQFTWKRKPVLRQLYFDWYNEIAKQLSEGITLELGGGTGNLKEFSPNVICTDIVKAPWLDAIADAQTLPFKDNSLNNIVLFDVLHHIENPRLFFDEAVRTLRTGGRVIIIDPYISLASWFVYKYLHPEPVDFHQNPLEILSPSKDRKPFDSNQAIANLLFGKHLKEFEALFGELQLIHKRYMSYIVYPLSGGFEHRSFIPDWMVTPLLKFENNLDFLGRFLAFRILIVLEKQD